MRKGLLSVALGLSLLVSGCGSPPRSGTIYAMTHEPGHYNYEKTGSTCMAYDNNGWCKYSVDWYGDVWYPPTWAICLIGDDPDHKGKKGCFNVDESTYSKYSTGSHYPDAR